MSIGKFAVNLILTTELSNTQILEAVKVAYPESKTTMACIAWYKSDLRKKGKIAKRGAELPRVLPVEGQIKEVCEEFTE
jgi:hypothetical protein